jgi:hypothetical protein
MALISAEIFGAPMVSNSSRDHALRRLLCLTLEVVPTEETLRKTNVF